MLRLCSIPDQEYSIPSHNVKQKNHSLLQFDTLLNLLPVRFRPSDKRRRPWSVSKIQMEMDAFFDPDQPLDSQGSGVADHSCCWTPTGNVKCIIKVHGTTKGTPAEWRTPSARTPPSWIRQLGVTSSNQQITPPVVLLPFSTEQSSRYLCAQRILSNDLVRIVWSSISQQWADSFPVSASTEEFSISQCNRNPSSSPDIEHFIDTSFRHIYLDFQLLVIGAFFGVNFYFQGRIFYSFSFSNYFFYHCLPYVFRLSFFIFLVDIRSKKVWRNRSLTC